MALYTPRSADHPVLLSAALFAAALTAACSSSESPVAPTPVVAAPGPPAAGGATSTPPPSTPPPTATPAPSPPPAPTVPPPPQTARYRFTFDSLWSEATHPQDFPSDAHWSPIVGGTHNASVRFWQEGSVASDGIRDMAERGRTTPLDNEVRSAIAAGNAQHLLIGGAIGRTPGSVTLEFEVSQSHPLVTIVSMVAPSPDWFTGVSGAALFENGQWVDRRSIELGPWDAGTDSGPTFRSPDQATQPRQPIRRIDGFPFLLGGRVLPLARFTFERIS